MGFFSWECPCCGESIKQGNDWMGKCVALSDDGSVVKGDYDGYGRIDGRLGTVELTDMDGKFALYHQKCYDLCGRPAYTKPSGSADDQGCGDTEPEPHSLEDIEALKVAKKARLAREHAECVAYYTAKIAELEAEGKEVPDYMRRVVDRA